MQPLFVYMYMDSKNKTLTEVHWREDAFHRLLWEQIDKYHTVVAAQDLLSMLYVYAFIWF